MMRLCLFLMTFVFALSAKDAVVWKKGTVVFFKADRNDAGSLIGRNEAPTATLRVEFDIITPEVSYTVEDWSVPTRRLLIASGMQIEFSVQGKDVLVRVEGEKRPRKLRVLKTYAKPAVRNPLE